MPRSCAAEKSEDRSVDLFQALGVGGEVAVVDDVGRERGFLQGDIQSIAAAHAPSDRADAVLLHVGLRFRNSNGGVKVAFGAVFGHAAHDLVGLIGRGRHFSAIEIDRQRDVALSDNFEACSLTQSFSPHHSWITMSAGNGPLPAGV